MPQVTDNLSYQVHLGIGDEHWLYKNIDVNPITKQS
jgi:hypothetical protein